MVEKTVWNVRMPTINEINNTHFKYCERQDSQCSCPTCEAHLDGCYACTFCNHPHDSSAYKLRGIRDKDPKCHSRKWKEMEPEELHRFKARLKENEKRRNYLLLTKPELKSKIKPDPKIQ